MPTDEEPCRSMTPRGTSSGMCDRGLHAWRQTKELQHPFPHAQPGRRTGDIFRLLAQHLTLPRKTTVETFNPSAKNPLFD
ncbi:hypothetical protein [Sphaerotilus hippei]|uniref:hypothetical protein n=1 Tax=Sphaerotilus hippei TaxID=744406 RepID=UPI0011B6256A|nr:hypothetical protein [Sphaerotilus hippei]